MTNSREGSAVIRLLSNFSLNDKAALSQEATVSHYRYSCRKQPVFCFLCRVITVTSDYNAATLSLRSSRQSVVRPNPPLGVCRCRTTSSHSCRYFREHQKLQIRRTEASTQADSCRKRFSTSELSSDNCGLFFVCFVIPVIVKLTPPDTCHPA